MREPLAALLSFPYQLLFVYKFLHSVISLYRGHRPLLMGIGSHTIILPQRWWPPHGFIQVFIIVLLPFMCSLLGLCFLHLFLLLCCPWLSNRELCPWSPSLLINNTTSHIQFVPTLTLLYQNPRHSLPSPPHLLVSGLIWRAVIFNEHVDFPHR
jgi:hypothetical protein